MAERKLRKDVFLALSAIAWADGNIDSNEADAIVRAAIESGLSLTEIGEIEAATKTKVDLGAIDRTELSKDDRLFVYAVACWIAHMDGRVTGDEGVSLAGLAERLGIPDRPRVHAEGVALQVAALPEGDRPARYDLAALRRILSDKLGAARDPSRAT